MAEAEAKTTELERLARAAFRSDRLLDQDKRTEQAWIDVGDRGRQVYADIARAILTALRKPSEGMYRAGAKAVPSSASKSDPLGSFDAKVIDYLSPAFRAMIDHILEEK